MGISDWLGLGTAISKPIKAVGDLYTTDKSRLEAEAKLTEAEAKYESVAQKPAMALIEVNRLFAMSTDFFKSAYIPLAGWTAGFLMLAYYFPQIVIITYVWGGECISTGIVKPFPMKPDDILNLVYVMCAGGVHSLFNTKGKG